MNMMASASAWPGGTRAASGRLEIRYGKDGNRMGEDLMTRRQVASLFGVTSAAVATWARRGRLPEVRDEAGRPRYRKADVQTLFRNGLRRRTR
jgi:MerR HTH family regulatory protein